MRCEELGFEMHQHSIVALILLFITYEYLISLYLFTCEPSYTKVSFHLFKLKIFYTYLLFTSITFLVFIITIYIIYNTVLEKYLAHFFFFFNFVDFNEARLHEAAFNLHMHVWMFSCLSIASVDGKQHLREVVFSALVSFSL